MLSAPNEFVKKTSVTSPRSESKTEIVERMMLDDKKRREKHVLLE